MVGHWSARDANDFVFVLILSQYPLSMDYYDDIRFKCITIPLNATLTQVPRTRLVGGHVDGDTGEFRKRANEKGKVRRGG